MIKVLHITPHLGGGVGRVLSQVALHRKKNSSNIDDIIVCLEPPEKEERLIIMRNSGVHVVINPQDTELDVLIKDADIIQVEWWHHPLIARFLSCYKPYLGRLIIWAHVSGFHFPIFPTSFLNLPDFFLFTTAVSHQYYAPLTTQKTGIVYSSGGFGDISQPDRTISKDSISYGYTGTLSPSKLHPDILTFLHVVDIPGFSVDFFGDYSNHPLSPLINLSENEKTIRIHGYVPDIIRELENLDVFIYILNPQHYGSTENGLLEAMAAGVVPVVLNNPVESSIVKDGETGFVIDSPKSFAHVIRLLHDNPDIRKKMSINASKDIRSRFSLEQTVNNLDDQYAVACSYPKHIIDTRGVFGSTPFEWFSSCLGNYTEYFMSDKTRFYRINRLSTPILYEKSKASAFHYHHYFPEEPDLNYLMEVLTNDLASLSLT
jgi:glycosyltransferase involved in cell wall biosynthesis